MNAQIEQYITDFREIVGYLLRHGIGIEKGGFLYIKKELMQGKLLVKNDFAFPKVKLKMWQSLQWIETEEEHLTARIAIDGEVFRMFKVNLNVFYALQKLGDVQEAISFFEDFCKTVEDILEGKKGIEKDNFLLVERALLPLNVNTGTLSKWRSLGWITGDGRHCTVKVQCNNSECRMIKICLNVYSALCGKVSKLPI
jgi:hypothetical protein